MNITTPIESIDSCFCLVFGSYGETAPVGWYPGYSQAQGLRGRDVHFVESGTPENNVVVIRHVLSYHAYSTVPRITLSHAILPRVVLDLMLLISTPALHTVLPPKCHRLNKSRNASIRNYILISSHTLGPSHSTHMLQRYCALKTRDRFARYASRTNNPLPCFPECSLGPQLRPRPATAPTYPTTTPTPPSSELTIGGWSQKPPQGRREGGSATGVARTKKTERRCSTQ